MAETRDTTAMTLLFLRNACLRCSMYCQVHLRSPGNSRFVPESFFTHFFFPRDETCRLYR